MKTLKLGLLYRDANNYKTFYERTISLKDYPEASKLKAGDEITMGEYGTLDKDSFFPSDEHPHIYNDDFDHNFLEVESIK